jgi:hypothetical protein
MLTVADPVPPLVSRSVLLPFDASLHGKTRKRVRALVTATAASSLAKELRRARAAGSATGWRASCYRTGLSWRVNSACRVQVSPGSALTSAAAYRQSTSGTPFMLCRATSPKTAQKSPGTFSEAVTAKTKEP